MRLAHAKKRTIAGQPLSPLSTQWGSAAGAQIQTSPGASALAAPHQNLLATVIRRARAEWPGFLETGVMLGGVAGLIGGLYLLATSPLPGVVTMLASMTLLLSSVGKLSAVQEARQRCEVTPVSAHRTRANLGHRSGLNR
jgi:hypothetical protein